MPNIPDRAAPERPHPIAVATALESIGSYRAVALLLVAVGIVTLTVVIPVAALFEWTAAGPHTRLGLPPIPGGDLGLGWNAEVRTPAESQQSLVGLTAAMLLTVAAATIAIAAITILILSLARESARAGELAVRQAVGASRRLLLRSALLEGGMLVLTSLVVGGAAGLALARWASLSWPGVIRTGYPLVGLFTLVPLAAAVLIGTALPVILPRRRVHEYLGISPTPLAPAAFQLGVGLVVLTLSTALARYATELLRPRAGAGDGLVMSIALPDTTPSERSAGYAALLRGVRLLDGVDSASLTSPGALLGLGPISMVTTDCGRCTEGGMALPWRVKPAVHEFVSSDTFRLMGLRLVAGRGISALDDWPAPRVAVVNRSLATREFQDGQAVGRRIHVVDDGGDWSTVVGVVDDSTPIGLGGALQPEYTVYLSTLQHPPTSVELLIRGPARIDASPVTDLVKSVLGSSGEPWRRESTLRASQAAPVAWFGGWFTLLGWAVLTISLVGAGALTRLWMTSLLSELGLRRAVGAGRTRLLGFVLLRAGMVGVAGIGLGLCLGQAVWGVLPGLLSGIRVWELDVVAPMAALLLASSVAGALAPAWRASRVTPASLIASRPR